MTNQNKLIVTPNYPPNVRKSAIPRQQLFLKSTGLNGFLVGVFSLDIFFIMAMKYPATIIVLILIYILNYHYKISIVLNCTMGLHVNPSIAPMYIGLYIYIYISINRLVIYKLEQWKAIHAAP
mgnify:CR=1 FL=1